MTKKIKDAKKQMANISELQKYIGTYGKTRDNYAALFAEKKKLYSGYHAVKKNMQDLLIAKGKADKILGVKPDTQEHDTKHTKARSGAHEI